MKQMDDFRVRVLNYQGGLELEAADHEEQKVANENTSQSLLMPSKTFDQAALFAGL